MKISEMHILLTGASGGIGAECAIALAQNGARILAVGRDDNALQLLINSLPSSKQGNHDYLVANLTCELQRSDFLSKVVSQHQSVNTLINMAGINSFGWFEEQTPSQIQQIVDTNITATLLITRALIPLLRAKPEARIINIGSTFGSIGFPGYVAYCSSKFAVRGFSEALSRELADTGITVQYFAPRATNTELNCQSSQALNTALKNTTDSPRQVALEIIKCVRTGSQQHYLGWPEKLFIRVNGMLPSIVSNSINKQLETIKGFARNQ